MTAPYTRMDLINYLIQKFGYTKYLEIGVQTGACFQSINCAYKVGVDPDTTSKATIHKTSDEFFAENKEQFDIVFIDGLHEAPQVLKDIENSLSVLSEGGIIVCHDMLPRSYEAQLVPRIQQIWNGNVWEAFVHLRSTRNDLAMCTIESDEGLGIIMEGVQTPIDVKPNEITWTNFCVHRSKWMNTMSYQEFYELLE